MDNIELSICIPTRNFGLYIHATLDSIIGQKDARLEIIILDGGSTDETQAIVEELANRYSFIRYCRQDTASGIDRDLATAVRMARGRYCWLMSADDVPKLGAIKRVLNEIRSGYDTYLCNRTDCDINLKPVVDRFWLDSGVSDCVINFRDQDQVVGYFEVSQSLGAVFSYISSIIFARQRWEAVSLDDRLVGSNYMHVHTLLQILKLGGVHKYIRDQLVYCRGGNDSFLEVGHQGIVRRYLIDLDGYLAIMSALNYPTPVRNAFASIMRKEHPWFMWIRVAIRLDDKEKWKEVARKLFGFGYSPVQLLLIRLIRGIERVIPIFSMLRLIRKGFST